MAGEPASVTKAAVRDAGVMAQVHVRWDVKTGGDPEAAGIDAAKVQPTTIANLASAKAPAAWPPPKRVAPIETIVWQVDATLTAYKHENDGDYHLVITDDHNNTMVVEIPDPAQVVPASVFKAQIQGARTAFDNKFGQQLAALATMVQPQAASAPMIISVSEPVRVEGIGFFDFPHGATGAAPNCIELHPVLAIEFQGAKP